MSSGTRSSGGGLADSVPVTAALGNDAYARRRLRRAKAMATGFLLLAAVLYAVTFVVHDGGSGAWGYLRAASEAGMVGGAADWFAVTALFRHPLGIPIPHTALIPERKDALGRTLQDFVGDNFLAESIVRERLAAARVPERLGAWLVVPEHARRTADELADVAAAAIRRLDPAKISDVADVLSRAIEARLPFDAVSPFLGQILDAVVNSGGHRLPMSRLLDRLADWLDRPDALKDTLVQLGLSKDTFLGNRFINLVELFLRDKVRDLALRSDEQTWSGVDDLLRQVAERLRTEPDTIATVSNLLRQTLTAPELRTAVRGSADFFRTMLAELLADHDGELRDQLTEAATSIGRRLQDDAELRQDIEQRLGHFVATAVTTYRGEITTVISATVDRWDGNETARRIELLAGRDLQFIRLNGTAVGALVGVAIHAISTL
jgi:uncharacterized membrane-anchored protein YjiN (DUF445 family)